MQNGADLECPKCHKVIRCFLNSATRCSCGQIIQLQLQINSEPPQAAAGSAPAATSHATRTAAVAPPPQHKSPVPAAPAVKTLNTGRWTKDEHEAFVRGLGLYGREWKKVANLIPTRTVVQIRTHAQKYFQKLAKEQGVEATSGKRGRPKKKSIRAITTTEPDDPPPSKRMRTQEVPGPHLIIRHRSYITRSDNPIGAGGNTECPTPRTMQAAVTLVDQRTTARLEAGKNTPRTRAAAEWLAELHEEGSYTWGAAAAAPADGAARAAVPAALQPAHPAHPAHPAPYHPQYRDPRAGKSNKPQIGGKAPSRMSLVVGGSDSGAASGSLLREDANSTKAKASSATASAPKVSVVPPKGSTDAAPQS